MKRLSMILSAMLLVSAVKAQLFQQNFQSSTTVSDYVSLGAPTIGQFNQIYDGDLGNDMVIDINTLSGNNTLRFTRSGNSTGGYTRVTDFTTQPSVLTFKFDIKVSGNLPNNTDQAAAWYFGNNFSAGGTPPATSGMGNLTYSYFYLNIDDNFTGDRARFHTSTGSDGTYFPVNETQQVFFIANNSGEDINYIGPDGSIESLGNDEWDLWVGNNLDLDDITVTGANEAITDMKFLFNNGTFTGGNSGSIELDNIEVSQLTEFAASFYQDFSASTLVGFYDNGGYGQFNQIYDGDSDNDMQISINSTSSNKLRFTKTADGAGDATGGFTRSTSLSGNPNTLMIEMDVTISGNLNDDNNAAKFYVGQGFSSGSTPPSGIHSYFEIDFNENGATDQFRFRKGGLSGINDLSQWFNVSGSPVRLLFVINNSGSAINYVGPDGIEETLNNDNYVLWVGNAKAFGTNGTASGAGNDLDDFKFLFNNGIGIIDFDNILITPVPEENATIEPQIINAQANPQFKVKWTLSTPLPVTGYRVDVATDDVFTNFVSGFENLYVDGASTLEQLVTGVSMLNDHYMRVRPVYQIGSNEVSGEFSNVTLLSSLEFLPVELTSFTASLVNKSTELKWATSEELNSSHYEVERSSDGRSFTKIGSVTSMNSATGSSYKFSDNNPASGKNYYRLKMVDIDGKFEYSHVVMVTNNAAVRMDAYPNPTSSKVTVQFSKANAGATMKVVSMEGRVMNQLAVPANSTQMDVNLSGMVPGIYTLIYTNNGEQSVKRIQKL